MQVASHIWAQQVAQSVIAVFDDWEALQTVLVDMAAAELDRSSTVLHARTDDPPLALSSGFLKEVVKLHFVPSRQRICCTRGEIADDLAARSARGSRSLADALHSGLASIRPCNCKATSKKGAWYCGSRLQTREEFGAVCGRLVQASPHVVGVCNTSIRAVA